MKKTFIAATIICSFVVFTAFNVSNENSVKIENINQGSFCEGWEDGYCEGWKDVKGQMALCPLTPLCPLPKIGENSYRGGYNRAFKAGMRAAKNN